MTTTQTTIGTPATTSRRRARVAGLTAASAAAVAVSLVPHVAAAADSSAVEPGGSVAAQRSSGIDALPTAHQIDGTSLDNALGEELPRQTDQAARPPAGNQPTEDRGSGSHGGDGGSVPHSGRGAQYTDDDQLITIPRAEQPEARPASDGQIDQWIREALEVMHKHDIPGTYDGIHRNLMRESSGDPRTINMWDSNAHENIPSKGLLQVIEPTFEQYQVPGTSDNIYDPVSNIAAASNYAADRYGSMDNVDSAY
ncbi:transglycosylase SLT domain-containing protein [Streptomyces sp. B6B3]|uniref:transglycosylase SLT domain-containing protein n=1 Tax=Streptomyces sp. B6B3 TaxID=3153570 RepID=UPI00325C7F30